MFFDYYMIDEYAGGGIRTHESLRNRDVGLGYSQAHSKLRTF